MKEDARRARNDQRMTELNPVFRARLARIIKGLEAAGFRPRIQDAWRSPEAQMTAFRTGHSKLRWGFHNATTPDGRPDGLAVDLLDDDSPLSPGVKYLVALARAALSENCQTGIAWGLPPTLRSAVESAVRLADDPPAGLKIGWDPTHVEPADVSVPEAKAGVRPR